MDIELSKIRNVMVVGSTGSGKSSTCNTFSGLHPGPFIVSEDVISCTSHFQEHVCVEKKIRIIDAPGFQDNTVVEKNVDKILHEIIMKIADPSGESTNRIDAFLLVCKLTPRPQTLLKDLERLKQLFGSASLKSLILVVIYESEEQRRREDFFSNLIRMSEIVRILSQAKGEQPHEGWFSVWDNKTPLRGQQEELLKKIQKLEPYTYKNYLEAEKEMKVLIDERLKGEMDREIARISKDHQDEKLLKEKYIEEIKQKYDAERSALKNSTEKAHKEVADFLLALSRMRDEDNRRFRELHERMSHENEVNEAKIMDYIRNNQSECRETVAQLMQENSRLLERQTEQLAQILQQAQMNKEEDEETGFLGKVLGTISTVGSTMITSLASKAFSRLEAKLESQCNMF